MSGWEEVVGAIAPTIGTAIGGPIGGMAVSALCGLFGIDTEEPNKEEALEKAITKMTPEQAVQLQKLDNDFKTRMRELNIDVLKLQVKDKASARQMYSKAGLSNKLPQITFGSLIVLGSFYCFYLVMSGDMPKDVDGILAGTIIGALISELKQLSGFFFGTSVVEADREDSKNSK